MVIYGEYLFMENCITGGLLLYFTARLTGCPARRWRLLTGAAVSGISGFLIFLPLDLVSGWLVRLAVAICLSWISLGGKQLIKKTGIFFLLSILSGGLVMALLIWQNTPLLVGSGAFYMGAATYGKLVFFGAAAMGGCHWFVKLIKSQRARDQMTGNVKLTVCGESFFFQALVDSGNSLREPLTGRPVILIDERGWGKLEFTRQATETRFTVIPYQAVGVEKGILTGIRLDEMEFEGRVVENVILAHYEGRFQDFEVLLNRDILEGGILEHGASIC